MFFFCTIQDIIILYSKEGVARSASYSVRDRQYVTDQTRPTRLTVRDRQCATEYAQQYFQSYLSMGSYFHLQKNTFRAYVTFEVIIWRVFKGKKGDEERKKGLRSRYKSRSDGHMNPALPQWCNTMGRDTPAGEVKW